MRRAGRGWKDESFFVLGGRGGGGGGGDEVGREGKWCAFFLFRSCG